MSDEYSIHSNFQRDSDDPRAEAEFEYRMGRVREREAEREAAAARYGGALRAAADVARQRRAERAQAEVEGEPTP